MLARQVAAETDEDAPPVIMSAAQVAEKVARECLTIGAGLAIERSCEVYPIFPSKFVLGSPCRSGTETGHIPTWLYRDLGAKERFSPHLRKAFQRFSDRYYRATSGTSVAYNKECDLLREFAQEFVRGDRRLFFPLEQLDLLRVYEKSGANRKARDHFFHTFNNLFLGFRILAGLAGGPRHIAEIDRSVASPANAKLNPWEVLWFLTCVFHDPAYVAEDPWATLRFGFGVEQDLSRPDAALPTQCATEIHNLWETFFARARADLCDLYDQVVRNWLPPSVRSNDSSYFDESLKKAYFDGRFVSHSVLSAIKLINGCNSDKVAGYKAYKPELALTCCVIAGLSMLFHDQRCREILQKAHIGPVAFEKLPYAALLMFVDCLQDDRRDITSPRFRKHGVLAGVEVSQVRRQIKATVCLREIPVEGWSKRIAEYESVLRWINSKSETRFAIDYRTLINPQHRVA
ncbi:MAG TPA: hypothetical protein VGV68_11870 [Terriglobia bacterium]|nr:hypothetical protein [Terriglobia bacterium]